MPDINGEPPVLILGAGVNGAALARELLLNNIPVSLVDRNDVAFGATSKSSRLIHGGLRYLEYGDVRLVRESLAERSRLHRLAPHLVRPLKLAIPVRKRFGGMLTSAARFVGVGRRFGLQWLSPMVAQSPERGLYTVRAGLEMYDRFAGDASFPAHTVSPVNEKSTPRVDANRYQWLCTYTDGQMPFPERFVIELIEDARRIAVDNSLPFHLHTYSTVNFVGPQARVEPVEDGPSLPSNKERWFVPSAVINATGAWGDATLDQIGVKSERLFGGTKGSHFITYQPALREALGDGGVYAEAADGRLVFVLPYRDGVLVGTTDERFNESPEKAIATETELAYLLELVNELFPSVNIARGDIEMHYSGIRPLPYVEGKRPSAVTRDHRLVNHPESLMPTFTLVGGKLTTARAFADDVATSLLISLRKPHIGNSRNRPFPGGVNYPADAGALSGRMIDLSQQFGLPLESIQAMWELFGSRTAIILERCKTSDVHRLQNDRLVGTAIPLPVVRWVIDHEWVASLEDLVERRLLLLDRPGLTHETFNQLAKELITAGRLSADEIESTVNTSIARWKTVYGKTIS